VNPLSIAFVGGSVDSAAGNCHRIAAEMDNCFRLVAGHFSRNLDTNYATGEAYGIDHNRCYSSLEELIEVEITFLDALVILTPTPAHQSNLLTAASKRLPIICEKSLTTSVQGLEKVSQILHENRGFLRAIYNYTGYPMVRELKSIFERGILGNLLYVEVSMPQEGFLRQDSSAEPIMPQDWRQVDDFIPTVSLDLGIHAVHLLRFVTGFKAHSVVAHYSHFGHVTDVIDNVVAVLVSETGVVAQLQFGKVSLGDSNGLAIKVHGTLGTAQWLQIDPEFLSISDNRGLKKIIHRGSSESQIAKHSRYNRFKPGHPSGFLEAFANHYQDIADDLQSYKLGKPSQSAFTFSELDAMDDLKILHALSDSHHQHSWVQIP
jgi:predicted dehydrogenase